MSRNLLADVAEHFWSVAAFCQFVTAISEIYVAIFFNSDFTSTLPYMDFFAVLVMGRGIESIRGP